MRTVAKSDKGTASFYAKACPRCKGDMYKSSDTYGSFISCYQCGYDMAQPKVGLKSFEMQRSPLIPEEDIFEESA